MPWTVIFELLMKLVTDCFAKGQSKEQVREQIKRPGPAVQFLFENRIREHLGIKRKDWVRGGKREEIMDPIYRDNANLSDEAVDEIIDETQETDDPWFA